ncbi:hypothetical protein B7494_g6779 [Chlorociboria aeruginascens]|nr:hypothetical protein B7494_g6779 [Chlorociboria aeruginascens]
MMKLVGSLTWKYCTRKSLGWMHRLPAIVVYEIHEKKESRIETVIENIIRTSGESRNTWLGGRTIVDLGILIVEAPVLETFRHHSRRHPQSCKPLASVTCARYFQSFDCDSEDHHQVTTKQNLSLYNIHPNDAQFALKYSGICLTYVVLLSAGSRFPQQSAGNYYYPQPHHPRHLLRTGTPPNNIRSPFNTETPSPTRSPGANSPAQNIYGMFNQGHQQGQHGRVNGGPAGRGMPLMYNFQHQSSHQPQHTQHHQNVQQDHGGHANGAAISHHTAFSSGVLSNSTPSFTPSGLPNGHSATTRGGQAQQINEHWAEQLKLHKESERAHTAMVEGHAPHHYARIKAGENRVTTAASSTPAPAAQPDGEVVDRGRPSNMDSPVKRQDWHSMDLSGQGLRVLGMPLFNYTFLNELYVASNKITRLPAAIGELRQLRHLDASNNLLTELPAELGMCVYLKQLLLFDNAVRVLPHELGSLYQLEMLGIEGNPLENSTRQEIMERGTKSLIHQLKEVPFPPAQRSMLELRETGPAPTEERVKTLSYNILCRNYVTPQQYGYTATEALAWDYRKEKILQEIQTHDTDFVCLQEVDTDTFKEFLSMKLAYNDYRGIFFQKTRAKTMSEKDAKAVDGCAIFYKASKYILLDKQLIDFANIAINRPDMKNQHDIFNRVMPRDHVAIISFFENRLTGSRFIVVNAHLFWDPVYADVKLIQMAILLESINKAAEKWYRHPACKDKKTYTIADEASLETAAEPPPEPANSKEYSSKTVMPLLLCGDFNSMPDSTVYELIATGRVMPDHPELSNYQYGNFTRDGIEHPFSLRSAYSLLFGTPQEMTFTNYTPGFKGLIDHIWYSTNALEATSILGPPDAEYMKRVPGLPNYHFPSDHLPLVVEFAIKGSKKEKKIHPEPDFGPSSGRRRD